MIGGDPCCTESYRVLPSDRTGGGGGRGGEGNGAMGGRAGADSDTHVATFALSLTYVRVQWMGSRMG